MTETRNIPQVTHHLVSHKVGIQTLVLLTKAISLVVVF